MHYGNPLFSPKHFQRTINFIKDNPDVYCALNGDLCEAVTIGSKGNIYKQTVSPKMQRDDMKKYLEPIKDKILGMTTGNHENRIKEVDISEDIAEFLEVPYRPEGMLLKISFGSGNENHIEKPFVFWAYITHGYGGARTTGGKIVKVERTSTFVHADFYAMSHDHVVNASPKVYFMPDNRGFPDIDGFLSGKISAHREMLIKTNAYVKWGEYSEMGGFSPTDLSSPIIMLLTPQSELWSLSADKKGQAVKVLV